MPRFRMHSGSLAESLATTFDFATKKHLVAHVQSVLPGIGDRVAQIHARPYGGDDDRCGWRDVHIVEAPEYGVVGFIEGPMPQ